MIFRNGDGEKRAPVEVKKGKQARVWELSGTVNAADAATLDYSKFAAEGDTEGGAEHEDTRFVEEQVIQFFKFVF